MKNTKGHKVYIQGPSVILPDASYYKEEMAQQKEMILGIWTNIAKMIMAKTPLPAETQEKYIEDTLKETMETYAPLLYTASIKFDPLVNVDFTETFNRTSENNSSSKDMLVTAFREALDGMTFKASKTDFKSAFVWLSNSLKMVSASNPETKLQLGAPDPHTITVET